MKYAEIYKLVGWKGITGIRAGNPAFSGELVWPGTEH